MTNNRELVALAERRCATCDSEQHLQKGHGEGGLNDVCLGCFFIWYDGDIPRENLIRGEDMREASLKAKIEGTWPFNGTQLPIADQAEKNRAIALRATTPTSEGV